MKPFRGLLGAREDMPPLFESMRGGVAVGEPAGDVPEREAQQRLARGGIGPFELVGHQIMQGVHKVSVMGNSSFAIRHSDFGCR